MKKKSITKGDSYKMVYYALLLCSRRELSAGQEEGMKYIKLGSWQRKLRLLYIYSLILILIFILFNSLLINRIETLLDWHGPYLFK